MDHNVRCFGFYAVCTLCVQALFFTFVQTQTFLHNFFISLYYGIVFIIYFFCSPVCLLCLYLFHYQGFIFFVFVCLVNHDMVKQRWLHYSLVLSLSCILIFLLTSLKLWLYFRHSFEVGRSHIFAKELLCPRVTAVWRLRPERWSLVIVTLTTVKIRYQGCVHLLHAFNALINVPSYMTVSPFWRFRRAVIQPFQLHFPL